jgi:hypothetical protein
MPGQAGARTRLKVTGVAAPSAGRHGDAYEQLDRIFDSGDVAYQPFIRPHAIADLADAAVQVGRRADARVRMAQLEGDLAGSPAPMLQAELSYARPVLADGERAGSLYEAGWKRICAAGHVTGRDYGSATASGYAASGE